MTKIEDILEELNFYFTLTFQQKKQFESWCVNCEMWQENDYLPLAFEYLQQLKQKNNLWNVTQKRDYWFSQVKNLYEFKKRKKKEYSDTLKQEFFPKYRYEAKELKGSIFRTCPAASEKTVCCNLKVLNLVSNCAMECSYCVLQNHYDEAVIEIPTNLKEKLSNLRLDENKKYRICTGEYSDSLMWGNQNNILTDCCDFAEKHQNIILEFKTKSNNIGYFLKNDIPKNVCCSWSLNPQVIVENEEKKTASLEQRLFAARKVADRGIKVAFHFHPMMYFVDWEKQYQNLIQKVMKLFKPEEVLWVSLGCVTLMKGFEQKLQKNYQHSKILQMETEWTQDNKLTYAFRIRKQLYQNALESLSEWQGKVFQYLCMEPASMWDVVMPHTYQSVHEFEDVFNASAFEKL